MKSRFHYKAIDHKGGKIEGEFYGTLNELKEYIRAENLTLYDFSENQLALDKSKFQQDDFLLFIEELTYLIKAGMKIDDAFRLMLKNTKKQTTQLFLQEIIQQLQSGKQFSQAIEEGAQKIHFPLSALYVNLIKSGEEIGEPVYALESLYDLLKFRISLAKEIKSALVYPLFLLSMSLIMVIFVLLFVVPQFAELFTPKELEKIPALSRLVLESGMYFKTHFIFVAGSFLLLSGLLVVVVIKYKNKLLNILSDIPYFKKFFVSVEISTFFNSLGSLLNAGTTLDKALKNSVGLIKIPQLKIVFENAQENLRKGKTLSSTMEGYEIIPSYIPSLISVGEKSGELGKISILIAEKEMNSFQNATKKVLLLLEPAIIVILGFFIAGIVVSIMLAVISVNDII